MSGSLVLLGFNIAYTFLLGGLLYRWGHRRGLREGRLEGRVAGLEEAADRFEGRA